MMISIEGETQADVAKEFAAARKLVEKVLNKELEKESYDLSKLSLLITILEKNLVSQFPESTHFNHESKVAEFKLRISHAEFKRADVVGKRNLIFQTLIRAVVALGKLNAKEIDTPRLKSDIRGVARRNGWHG